MNREQLINRKLALFGGVAPIMQAQAGDAFNLKNLVTLLVQLETSNEMTPQMTEATEYASYIPVKSNFPATVGTKHTLQRKNGVGEGQDHSGTGVDIPLAEVFYDNVDLGVRSGAIGYQYSILELATASQAGVTLEADKIQAARLAFEKHMSRIAWVGDLNIGLRGLFNQTGVNIQTALKKWETATPDEILADVNDILSDAIEASEFNPAIIPDTMILPTSLMRILTQRRIADNLETTLFEWVSKNNLLALEGKKLTIRSTSRTESMGVGGARRITVYRRDPGCIEMRIPKELEFLAPQPSGLDLFTPGYYLYQGVWLKRVDSLRYMDVPKI